MFHPVVDAWFRSRFREATPVQAQAWPLIAAGRDVLMTAPTGSGKTLAAFPCPTTCAATWRSRSAS